MLNIEEATNGAFTKIVETPYKAIEYGGPTFKLYRYGSGANTVYNQIEWEDYGSTASAAATTSAVAVYMQQAIESTIARQAYTYNEWGGAGTTSWGQVIKYYYYGDSCWAGAKPVSAQDKLREIIKERMAPRIHVSRSLDRAADEREIAARQTLARVLGDDGYCGFLKNGFVTVRGKSGLTYQIFPGHKMTNVYNHGKFVEKLCVVMDGNFPPTDELIMRYLLILNDENEFRKYAIVHHSAPNKRMSTSTHQGSLSEILKTLKVKKAA
jgi:hypothetical protein